MPNAESSASERHALLTPHTDGSASKSTTLQRQGAVSVAQDLYRTEGIGVFFRGLGICSVRAFIVNAVQWAIYEWMMNLLRAR